MKTTEPAAPVDDSAVADRFKLDMQNQNAKGGSSGVATTIALLAGLLALAVVGVLTFVIYQHWEYLQAA